MPRNNDMEGNREIGVVIDGRITMGCSCFTCLYPLVLFWFG